MCICKQREASNKSSPSNSTNRRRSLVSKGMPPPPSKPSMKKESADSKQPGRPAPSSTILSLGQLSSILDPFFDTCVVASKQRQRRLASASAAAGTTERECAKQRRNRADFLSVEPVLAQECLSATADDVVAISSGFAFQDVLGSGNSSFHDMLREMEAEKNDMLRLDVRVV